MVGLIGFVDYTFENLAIPAHHVGACHAALEAHGGRRYVNLRDGLRRHYHDFFGPNAAGLRLEWIALDVWWCGLEPLYRRLAPFVQTGGRIYCVDEEANHVGYMFDDGAIRRVQGRVIYDGRPVEL